MQLRWIAEAEVEPERALATGASLLDSVREAGSPPAVLYGASLTGKAVVLGEWQRAGDAVRREAAEEAGYRILRRSTGGPAARAGEGILYVALCLRHASAFMSCPPDRVLNRNVRGVLGGLSLSGTPAHYFGREWLSVARRPAALVGWDRHPEGEVLLEFFIAHAQHFAPPPEIVGYPSRTEPPFLGKEPVTLREAWEQDAPPEQIVRWIAEGHRSRFGEEVQPDQTSLTDEERKRGRTHAERFVEPEPAEDGLTWSAPREVPVGWVSAGVGLDEEGRVSAVRVAGDFFQDHDAPRVLAEKLVGEAPDAERFAEAVNATWDGTKHVLEGLKELDSILICLLEASGLKKRKRKKTS